MKKQLSKQSRRPRKTDGWGLIVLLLVFLWLLLAGCQGLSAQTVKITPIGANYGDKTVTFRVSWSGGAFTPVDRVWVWIDFCPVTGVTPSVSFSPASIYSVNATNGGSVDASSLNGRGFFVTTNPTEVTARLSNAYLAFNWCAYGSGTPPRAELQPDGSYLLKGTPPFTITYNAGASTTTNEDTFNLGCITAITDLTGNPAGSVDEPNITAVTSPTICYNTAANLTLTVSGGTTTAMTYTWNIGGASSTTSAPTITTSASLIANTTYTVQARNAAGCTSAVSGIGTVTVLQNPALPALSRTGNTCAGTAITFTASGGSGVYDWSGTFSGSGNSKTTGTTAGNYIAEVRSVLTSGDVTCYSNYESATGTINVVPGVPNMGGGGTHCSVPHSITATKGTNGNGIRWTDGSGTTSPRSVNANGTWYAVSTTAAGCESSPAGVTVIFSPAVGAATISGYTANTCPTKNVSLTASATNASIYTWFKNSTQVQSGPANNYTVVESGTYTVRGECGSSMGAVSLGHAVVWTHCYDVPECNLDLPIGWMADRLDYTAGKALCEARGLRLPNNIESLCLRNTQICQNDWYIMWYTGVTCADKTQRPFRSCHPSIKSGCTSPNTWMDVVCVL
jgi:hypothetical protein